jgi:hypothetical protein
MDDVKWLDERLARIFAEAPRLGEATDRMENLKL